MRLSAVPRNSILVVDDDASIRAVIFAVLAQSFSVTTCASVDEALRLLNFVKPDLILTDLNMPDKDGFQLIQEVRRQGSNIPIVVISGALGDSTTLQGAKLLGANDILRKPLSISELLMVIEGLLAAGANAPAEK